MNVNAAWKELRAFDDCEPSKLAFRAMVAVLDTWPTGDQAEAIAYADQCLSRWPDAVRFAPWSWCKAASKGVTLPTWHLAHSLQLQSGHLSKESIDLVRIAQRSNLEHITELAIPPYSKFKELSYLYHRPDAFRGLKRLRATDNYLDADIRALADSPVWQTLEAFDTDLPTQSFAHTAPSRIVPRLDHTNPIQHLSLRASDLIAVWDATDLPQLQTVCVFICSIQEANDLAKRKELSRLKSLSLAFRCGFSGNSPFEPFLGTVIEADEAAADAFLGAARLEQLEKLEITGYSMGYWGREGLGELGLQSLIASGLLQQLKHLRIELLPLGDTGVAALAPALGSQLEILELPDVYCKGEGAAALIDSPCMASLRQLDLSANRIDADNIVQLASVEMSQLESLDLSGPTINPYYGNVGVQPILDAGAAAWANSINVRKLKRLRLSNCHLADATLEAVFQSSHLQSLRELDLSHASFTAAGISQSLPGSPIWNTLDRLAFNDCRLDNAAIEALAQVTDAPALRAIELGYNSIGPRGAAALANWSVLAGVWQLDLHDNAIGDEGLVALAQSANLGQLLELDFEQDCWNSRKFDFSDRAATAFANSDALPRLDCLFSGCVDEYHGCAYSAGFSKEAIQEIRTAGWLRPALKAACSDFTGISEYHKGKDFDENVELDDHDFRKHPFELNEREADQAKHRMQQLSTPPMSAVAMEEMDPPKISPLPELEFDDSDIIEGLEFQEPIPVIELDCTLSLSLEDDRRPLPGQVSKFLADTLESIFLACSLGSFDVAGVSSRKADDGSFIETETRFYLGLSGDPNRAIQLLREALWWVGAPEETEIAEFPLMLAEKPEVTAAGFAQLAIPKVTRWKSGHRIDRVEFSSTQREAIRSIVAEFGGVEASSGWARIVTSDGGEALVYLKYLDEAEEFDTLNFLFDNLTPGIASLVYRTMAECGFMLLPMAIAAKEEVAQTTDCEWPVVEIVSSAESLSDILTNGSYHWWRSRNT